jgi:hypothetical protein
VSAPSLCESRPSLRLLRTARTSTEAQTIPPSRTVSRPTARTDPREHAGNVVWRSGFAGPATLRRSNENDSRRQDSPVRMIDNLHYVNHTPSPHPRTPPSPGKSWLSLLNEPGPRLAEVGPICSSVSLKLAKTCGFPVGHWRGLRRTRPGSPGSDLADGTTGWRWLPPRRGLGRVHEAYPGGHLGPAGRGQRPRRPYQPCSGTTRTSRPPPWPQPPGRRARRTCRVPTPVNNRSPRLHAQGGGTAAAGKTALVPTDRGSSRG